MSLSILSEIGRRALATQQALLAITGHNIANAETRGYSRRVVTVKSAPSVTTAAGKLGTGVDVGTIKRVRDRLIDRAMQHEQHVFGYYKEQRDALQRVEGVWNEPSNAGLNNALSQLFNSFRGLADDPENAGVRATVLGAGQAIVGTLHRMDRQLGDLREQMMGSAQDKADRVNELLEQIANLNRVIAGNEQVSGEASAERDHRDLLVDELSELININTTETDDGSLIVSTGETTLVIQYQATTVRLRTSQVGDTEVVNLVRAESDKVIPVESGSIRGLIYMRDELLVTYQRQLDEIAISLVQEVNAIHKSGYGVDGVEGRSFFDENVTGAGDIAIDAGIEADVNTIAASLDGASGDNQNALALARLQDSLVVRNGTMTLAGSYHAMVGDVGARSRSTSAITETQELIVTKLENDRAAVSGVSLDEETANLITQQRSYQAAARLVRAADEMTETLLAMLR